MYTKTFVDGRTFSWVGVDSLSQGLPNTGQVTVPFGGTRQGERVPNWRARIRQCSNATGVYYLDRLSLESAKPGSVLCTMHETVWPFRDRAHSFNGYRFDSIDPSPHLFSSESKAEAMALARTYKNLRAHHSQMNGQTFVGEFKDVVHMLRHPAKGILDATNRYLDQLVKHGWKKAAQWQGKNRRQFMRNMGSAYLEWSFGVKPLIEDTKSIAESIARWNFEPEQSPRTRITGKGLEEAQTVNAGLTDATTGTWILISSSTRVNSSVGVKYVCGVTSRIQAAFGSVDRLAELMGFTPENFVPALYEVCPWSWLLDYFTNIGDIVEAACTNTTDVAWISRTVRYSTRSEYTSGINASRLTASADANQFAITSLLSENDGGRCVFNRVTLSRSSPASLGIPSLVLEHPFGKLGKVLNLAGVLFQRVPDVASQWKARRP